MPQSHKIWSYRIKGFYSGMPFTFYCCEEHMALDKATEPENKATEPVNA